jgi:putative ABC transport system permease protein
MYRDAMVPLLVLTGLALGVVLFLLVRTPVLRRLALRQIARRPTEAVLVVLGSLLGTTLIVASMVVGDSLDRSVRQSAYDMLGPVDETVRASSLRVGNEAAARLQVLRNDPRVDGLLTVRSDQAAAVHDSRGVRTAEPRTLVWELDFAAAARFGAPDASGLSVADPGPGRVVINSNLAQAVDATVGDRLTFQLYGNPVPFTVAQVVPAEGLAGMGLGATVNKDAFFSPGTLVHAAQAVGREPATATLVSNRGGVEGGDGLTSEVTAAVRQALGPLAERGAVVSAPKHEVLTAARQTGDQLGSLFLFIASFSIIAGVLLLVNIFVMLADERKAQLGILRAIGMRRRRVTGEFAIEGAVYGGIATLLGAALGLAVGRVVVILAVSILNGYSLGDNKLPLVYDVRPVSLVNGVCAGFLIAFLAVVVTSVRIARTNIIAAIRGLEPSRRRRPRRRMTVLSAVVTVLLVAAAWPTIAVDAYQGTGTYLLPALAAIAAVPLLGRVLPPKVVTTGVSLAVLAWGLVAHIVCPHVYDDVSTTTYVVLGTMLSFATVVLLSQHQWLVLRPLLPLIMRSSESGLALRLAVAYPTARRFRTGVTLAMYCIVVFVIVLLTEISAVIQAGVDGAIVDASAGWTVRLDYNPNTPLRRVDHQLTSGQFAGQVTEAAPLVTAPAFGSDPLARTDEPLPVVAIGVPGLMNRAAPALNDRLGRLPSDAAAWRLIVRDPGYVLVDAFYGAQGGPQGKQIEPGDTLWLTNRRTGEQTSKIIAGVLTDGTAFYGISGGEFLFPVLMGQSAAWQTFGTDVRPSSVLLKTAPGVDPSAVAQHLQSVFLANGAVATDVQQTVRQNYAANTQFFRLMQGYLALGLLVGITGLGVVMVRAVRERRRVIGVLRALGFHARTVRRAFLAESTFIAVEGVVVGTVLGVLTTWLLYQNSPAFGTLTVAFPIAWGQIALTVGAALLASLAATVLPARRAAGIKPALAVRVAE